MRTDSAGSPNQDGSRMAEAPLTTFALATAILDARSGELTNKHLVSPGILSLLPRIWYAILLTMHRSGKSATYQGQPPICLHTTYAASTVAFFTRLSVGSQSRCHRREASNVRRTAHRASTIFQFTIVLAVALCRLVFGT
jgi:hypothetical protein